MVDFYYANHIEKKKRKELASFLQPRVLKHDMRNGLFTNTTWKFDLFPQRKIYWTH